MLSQAEIRQSITNKIVDSLKKGKIPWRKPWSGIEGPRTPTNYTTKRRYSGVNVPILWMAGIEKGYDVDYWASFNQWKNCGASVKKGEKSTQIVFFKPIKKTVTDKNGSEKEIEFPILRTCPVFNIHQVTSGVVEELQKLPAGHVHEHEKRAEFDRVVAATGAEIRIGGNKACYHRLPADYIQMPEEERFFDFPSYVETTFHELTHWSEHRVGWKGSYAEGELRAEMAACFLSASLGFPPADDLKNHSAYIQNWLESLQNDPKFIFAASSAASKAADYIFSFSKESEEQVGEELEAVA